MIIAVKLIIKFEFLILLLLCAELCFAQTDAKVPGPTPKAKAPATGQVEKPQPKPVADEEISPAAPNAIFPAVVAKVNGKAILGKDLEELVQRELSSIGNPEWKNLREEYRGELTLRALNTLINATLLYQHAVASGTKASDAEVQAEMQKIAKTFKSDAEMNAALASQNTDRALLQKGLYESLTMSKFIEENITKKITVTPEEVAKYYSGNPSEFHHPDIVRTSHILIQPAGETSEQDAKAKERAESLLARVKKGEDFAKIAKENSVDASASQGGDIGFASKDSLAPEYAEAAFSLPVGGVQLVKTQAGYHVIKVTEKKREGLATLEETRPQLMEFLKDQKGEQEMTKLVNQLRDKGKIEILIPAGQPLKP
jgi:parvulin-like peptidyl-prolyl isomerase